MRLTTAEVSMSLVAEGATMELLLGRTTFVGLILSKTSDERRELLLGYAEYFQDGESLFAFLIACVKAALDDAKRAKCALASSVDYGAEEIRGASLEHVH